MSAMRWLLLLCLFGSACASSRLFAPRENLNGTGPQGHPAAVYRLDDSEIGEVRLWSNGARRVELPEGAETRLKVGFELENNSKSPMRLDTQAMRVHAVVGSDSAAEELSPVTVEGPVEAAPDRMARVYVEFQPATEVGPRDIRSFEVHWSVLVDGRRFPQVTPFTIFVPPPMYWDDDPYWGWDFRAGIGIGYAPYPYPYCR